MPHLGLDLSEYLDIYLPLKSVRVSFKNKPIGLCLSQTSSETSAPEQIDLTNFHLNN